MEAGVHTVAEIPPERSGKRPIIKTPAMSRGSKEERIHG
jgi:hypothetical protein